MMLERQREGIATPRDGQQMKRSASAAAKLLEHERQDLAQGRRDAREFLKPR
jgi:hypothetical protein